MLNSSLAKRCYEYKHAEYKMIRTVLQAFDPNIIIIAYFACIQNCFLLHLLLLLKSKANKSKKKKKVDIEKKFVDFCIVLAS